MRIKLNLVGSDGVGRPAAVTAEATATVADLASAIQAGMTQVPASPNGNLTLQLLGDDGQPTATLLPRSQVGGSRLASGQNVRVTTWEEAGGTGSSAPARLRVIAGADAGASHRLRLGPNTIGRDPDCDVILNDGLVSRKHAEITVADRIEIADTNSSNGVVMNDVLVDRAEVGPRATVVLGESTIMIEPNPDRMPAREASAELQFNRSPKVRPQYAGRTIEAPKPPARPKSSKFPLVAMVAPLLMGTVLFMVTQNVMSIMFVALSPLIAVGTYLDRKFTDDKTVKTDRTRFAEDMAKLRDDLAAALDEEHVERCEEVPSLDAAAEAAFSLNQDLWHRRPESEFFLGLNLGFGRCRSRHEMRCPDRGEADADTWAALEDLRRQSAFVNDVPVVANLRLCGNLGVAGSRDWVDPVAMNLVAQLVCLHSPAEVAVAAVASAESCARWNWLMWLPHVGSTHSPLTGAHLACTKAAVSALVTGIEELIAARRETSGKQQLPAVVVLVEDDQPAERGRLVGIAELGPAVGVHVIWLADRQDALPAACQAYLVKDAGGGVTVGFTKEAHTSVIGRVEFLSLVRAEELARQLAPILDAGAPVLDQSDVPRSVSYLALTGTDLASDPQVTVKQWHENGSLGAGASPTGKSAATLRALIGQGAQGDFTLDLRLQGPHALVGGTTGAGKSEFLQTWVLGMATEHSPRRVTFLFVDYKGGTAFADCLKLPHTVGLVTDLSPHLVRRALTSLKAELQYREHLLNSKKAKDLIALERTGDPDCPPALIIVVDEFAALANDLPDFVDGVVDVAQRGRSLGLHLILATQRPAGVITPNLRANTNLRVALRMADETDSTDVLDSGLASEFDPAVPGRGAVRTGPGRIALFQTGYVGGRTLEEKGTPRVEIETMTFGAGIPWQIPEQKIATDVDEEADPDISRIVAAVGEAFGQCDIPEPRKPWLPELKPICDLGSMVQELKASADEPLRLPIGVVDDPAHQAQRPAYYTPDLDGNFAVFGTSGAGKSALLRTVAVGAALQASNSRTDVYALDFTSGGLTMLESLPVVGAVIDGSDQERIARLMQRLTALMDARSERYSKQNAGSISEYRKITGSDDEPRVMLLVDGFGAFRDEYEGSGTLVRTYGQFTRLMSEGRAVGIHVVIAADRAGALSSSVGSTVQRRLVLRQADENAYVGLGVPADVLGPDSPPGRAVFSGQANELQVAVPGGSAIPADQALEVGAIAGGLLESGVIGAEPVEWLPDHITMAELPIVMNGQPVLGVADADLAPLPFVPQGGFVVAGLPGSGRTTALKSISQALHRWNPQIPLYYFGSKRSIVGKASFWAKTALDHDEARALVAELTPALRQPGVDEDLPGLVLIIEGIAELISSPCEAPMAEAVKQARRNGHLIVAENETSGWMSSWPLIAEVKANRRGIVMQPDQGDGDMLFKVGFPKVRRADYPLGRGVFAAGGKAWTVQLPFPN
ncbi:MAG: FHA domain-containing protein [Bifidobacteriaceae bacterium]|jgi:S-DNA-T family DNA segregation ATPase FtsK/SpoIIIE|nr:FHA domain-containing protein [Bifidobacteriaceae bacterium]